jgi:hypothetical protein
MIFPTRNRRLLPVCAAVIAGSAVAGMLLAAAPAAARVFVGVGIGLPGFYAPAPYPYYPYAYPYPYYYPPPPYYPPGGAYPPAAAPQSGYEPPGGPPSAASFSYTDRPGWTNAAGQPCREYKSTQAVGGRPTDVYGTACRDPNGTWRIVN